uniref:Uncharacterized protein n=1 Tax=Salix viminalis TaxID=40686 RepID=A0A6N2M2B8_SALVM
MGTTIRHSLGSKMDSGETQFLQGKVANKEKGCRYCPNCRIKVAGLLSCMRVMLAM